MTRHRPFVPLILAALLVACAKGDGSSVPSPNMAPTGDLVAAGGRVEPDGEERVVIPDISGRIARVLVEEGDRVSAGQVIAEIENADYAAALAATEAAVGQHRAELDRLRAGARREELDQARATLAAAEAQARLASAEAERRQALFARRLISAQDHDQAVARADAARAERARAAAARALLQAGARREDLAAAEAALAAAMASRDQARARFDKTLIRAPIDGVVLKRELRAGETVEALAPRPIARIGDMSRLFVRADIDELDIGRVRPGQKAEVSSDAFPGQHYAGEVVRVAQRMGKRNTASDDPAQKQDAKILEAVIALDGTPPLPVGLRVDVRIHTR